ncbi:MAG: FecR domain-containing protein [Oligoflexia bacterium]|nr:FecR domain-containing protein [Oligoflexia bacterium]
MTSYSRKLLIAAALSVTGVASSYGWYRYDLSLHSRGDEGNRKLLAHLSMAKNEVQKRSVKRVIWQRIGEDDPLYSGEAVRTAPDGEAKIIFVTGAEVDLEPDSVVVIEESGDKVALDFVKGNVYVKGNGDTSNLALKSGNTSISLNNADLSLGRKSGSGQGLDVQVYSGSAQVNSGDKTLTLDKDKSGNISATGMDITQQFFKLKTPAPNERVYVRVDKKEAVLFSWVPLTADFDVKLETGTKREVLKPYGQVVPGTKGEIQALLGPGSQFWRLVATNKKDPKQVYFSTVSKVLIVADFPPKLLSPAKDALASLNPQTKSLDLRWANPSKLVKLQIELSKDASFAKPIFSQLVEDTGVFAVSPKDDGEYYWRISGYRPGTALQLVSEPLKFMLRTKFQLIPPELKLPASDARISFETITNGGAYLVWEKVPGINKFHLRVEEMILKGSPKKSELLVDKEISDVTQLRIPQAKSGSYKWSVTSVDHKGEESKPSLVRYFTVEELPRLAWADGKDQDSFLYVTEKPSLKVSWKALGGIKADKYKVTVKTDGAEDKVISTTQLNQQVDVAGDGLFRVTVEAFDIKGVPIARTSTRDVTVGLRPLLPPPQFSERMPAAVNAHKNGSAQFSWKSVEGAKAYQVQVKSSDGQVAKSEKFNSTSGQVKGILPGEYKVSVSSVDEYGRPGPQGEEKVLSVPDVSDLKAPGFKKFKIQ